MHNIYHKKVYLFYDRVFDKDTQSAEVFRFQCQEIVERSVLGYNGAYFAMDKLEAQDPYYAWVRKINPGFAPLSIDHIFSTI